MRVAAVGLRGLCRDRLHRAEVLGKPGVGRLCRSGLRGRGNRGQLDAPGQRIDKGIHIVALAVGQQPFAGPLEWEQRPCAASLKRGESWSTTLSTTFVR